MEDMHSSSLVIVKSDFKISPNTKLPKRFCSCWNGTHRYWMVPLFFYFLKAFMPFIELKNKNMGISPTIFCTRSSYLVPSGTDYF